MTKIRSEGPTVIILNAVKDPDVRFTGFFAFAQNDEDSLRMTDCCHPERSEGSRC
ncbi:MAG: hypothetical protein PHU61_00115 [Candidatus Absconditabacteria bacterium]|nr:hypothetical protein [Candidatus Absconditabacteria bacterium]MDD4714188.1 hypothetical protein [Candidatus Absconditabacteria bacterium]